MRLSLAVLQFILPIVVLVPAPSRADCMMQEDGRKVSIQAKECRKISPTLDESIGAKAGPLLERPQIEKLYTGALLIDEGGQKWVYPSPEADPCKMFPIGKTVEKAAYEACCDTGFWGKCVFGGNFLGDVGGERINAFQ